MAVPTGSGGWYPRSFVPTDIVDSVSLWERDPDPMAQAVARAELDDRVEKHALLIARLLEATPLARRRESGE
jgi:hypothetical protein